MDEENNSFKPVGLDSPTSSIEPPQPDSPTAIRNTTATTTEDRIQLEPSDDEMEREKLLARGEQLQDEISTLRKQLQTKENELAQVKEQLGITTYTEIKEGITHGWQVVGNKWKELQETPTFRKIDDTLSGWKNKLEENEGYQKTKTSLNEGGKKASTSISTTATNIKESETVKTIGSKTSAAFSRTGTALKNTGTAIKENERLQSFGERVRTTSVRLKDRVMGQSVDNGVDGDDSSSGPAPDTIIPDEPKKKE